MEKKQSTLIMLIISVIGLLFSGYLSATKLFSGTCPLNEGCPIFFGYPACVYGFFIFLILFGIIIYSLKNKNKYLSKYLTIFSISGVLFSLYSTYVEVFVSGCIYGGCSFSLLLPTCIYGFLMYLSILVISMLSKEA